MENGYLGKERNKKMEVHIVISKDNYMDYYMDYWLFNNNKK